MSEPENEQPDVEHLIKVQVSPKLVHKSVRNIITNELGINEGSIKEEISRKIDVLLDDVRKHLYQVDFTKEAVNTKVWGWVQYHIEKHALALAEKVTNKQVREKIDELALRVVEATISQGVEIKMGYGFRDPKVKLTLEPPAVDEARKALEARVAELTAILTQNGIPHEKQPCECCGALLVPSIGAEYYRCYDCMLTCHTAGHGARVWVQGPKCGSKRVQP